MNTIFDCCDCCDALLTEAEKAAGARFGQALCDGCAAEYAKANPVIAKTGSRIKADAIAAQHPGATVDRVMGGFEVTGPKLTALESAALAALNEASRENGHDFGLLEQTVWPDRQQLGALLTSLQAKGVVTEVARTEVINDNERYTQYVLAEGYRA